MFEIIPGPEQFYSEQERQLVRDFASLGAYNSRTIDETIPDGALTMQDIELKPFGYSGECPEVAEILKSQMVKSFGIEPQLSVVHDNDELEAESTVFAFSDVTVAVSQTTGESGDRYFIAKYASPKDEKDTKTGSLVSLRVVNREQRDLVLHRYREDEVKSYLSEHLGLNSETMTGLDMSLEDMQAMARSFAEISKLEEHDPTKLPEMPDVDKKRSRALRSLNNTSRVALLLGEDINDEAVKDYAGYIEACSIGVEDEVYEHVLRLEQAKRLKALQDNMEHRTRVADTGHVIKTVGLTALMGVVGYGSGLIYDSKIQPGEIIEQGFQSNSAWKAGIALGAVQLIRSLYSVGKYMQNRALIKAMPLTSTSSNIDLTIAGQMHQEAAAFGTMMRLSRVPNTI